MYAVEAVDIVKTFGDVRALDGVTVRFEPGIVYGFLGPNGAGKTTLIRVLARAASSSRSAGPAACCVPCPGLPSASIGTRTWSASPTRNAAYSAPTPAASPYETRVSTARSA